MAAAIAASVAAGGEKLLRYNRENFLFDRKMRQKQELQIALFRSKVVGLWREDVRDIIQLTIGKMETYTLVNVILVTVQIEMMAAGRLGPGTPQWLLWIYVTSLLGAVVYQLLALWFSMHAGVAAQGMGVQILTQLVRLPVPTWEQLEAMRTYACSWEALQPQKLLRLPFVDATAAETLKDQPERRQGEAADVWGLERPGGGIYELQQRPPNELRHVKLVQRALVNWQSHESFTRVTMTMGVTEFLYAIMYYCIGYLNAEDGEPFASLILVLVLATSVAQLLQMDLSMGLIEAYSTRYLAYAAPMGAAVAGFFWCSYTKESHRRAVLVLPFVFGMHALSILHLLMLANEQRRQPSGTVLPTRWRAVLYIDIFGWRTRTSRGHNSGQNTSRGSRPRRGSCFRRLAQYWTSACCAGSASDRSDGYAPIVQVAHGKYEPRHDSEVCIEPEHRTEDLEANVGANAESDLWVSNALAGCSRGERDEPCDAECDTAPLPATDSLAGLLRGVGPPASVPLVDGNLAFDPSSFLPPGCITPRSKNEKQLLGVNAPWHVFKFMTVVLICLYSMGAVWSAASIFGISVLRVRPLPEIDAEFSDSSAEGTGVIAAALTEDGRSPSDRGEAAIEELVADGPAPAPPQPPQLPFGWPLKTSWPHSSNVFAPRALGCDERGERFIVADDFGVYAATLAKAPEPGSSEWAQFQRVPCCRQLEGHRPQDANIVCNVDHEQPGREICSALVLYAHAGQAILAECPLEKHSSVMERSWQISTEWLNDLDDEVLQTLALSTGGPPEAALELGVGHRRSVYVSTSLFRLVQLRQHVSNESQLVPLRSLEPEPEEVWSWSGEPRWARARGSLHVLPQGLVMALQPWSWDEANPLAGPGPFTLWALDVKNYDDVLGEWELPRGVQWLSLCSGGSDTLYMLGRHQGVGIAAARGTTDSTDANAAAAAAAGPAVIWQVPFPPKLRRIDPSSGAERMAAAEANHSAATGNSFV